MLDFSYSESTSEIADTLLCKCTSLKIDDFSLSLIAILDALELDSLESILSSNISGLFYNCIV